MSSKKEQRPQLGGLNPSSTETPKPRPRTAGAETQDLDDEAYTSSMAEVGAKTGFSESRNSAPHPAASHVSSARVAPAKRSRNPRPKSARTGINIEVPEYVRIELHVTAAQRQTTIKYLILEALQEAGYTIKPEDLVEDGRKDR